MKALTRYVTWELLKVFFLVLTALTLLIMLALVVQEAMRQGLGLGPIVRLAPYLLPMSLQFSVPGATLLVVSSVYGRMSVANEIVAVKSLGISPLKMVAPALWIGALLSVGCVWLNDIAVSWGRAGVRHVVVESVEEIIYRMLQTQGSYTSGAMSMNVRSVQGRSLVMPTLTVRSKGEQGTITISAARAELEADKDAGELTIRFYDSVVDAGDGRQIIWPDVYEHTVKFDDFSKRGNESLTPSNLPLEEIPADIAETQDKLVAMHEQQAAAAAERLLSGDFGPLAGDSWKSFSGAVSSQQRRLNRLRTEPHRRLANGLTCLCFALVGSTMAIRRKNGEFLTSFFYCFLPVLIVYYPLLALAVDRAKSGAFPPQAVWLGNIALVVWGVWLARRVLRY
ncbi:MAG: LptF/LptG family permease [Planctomycetales bacterium]|nr:LptF/LptG family permease [Planctomycetales bacterium]